MSRKKLTLGIAALAAIGIAAVALLGAFGWQEGADADADGAFVTSMVPHHESAIEMAEVARDRATHPEIKQLAGEIITTQSSEIETLGAIHERLYGEPVGAMDHGSMGMSAGAMGMDMDSAELDAVKPFDRAFIDMMIPHHQGAILMARTELDEGVDEATRRLATDVISAQSAEIEEMNAWRTDWYGSPSPAGGIPSGSEAVSDDAMSGMDH